MNLTISEATRHEYYNHWININFVEYPMGRPKQLGITKMGAVKAAIWNDNDFWLPLVRFGIEEATPEEMEDVAANQYDQIMELMNDGMIAALDVKESTPKDWAGMMRVTE